MTDKHYVVHIANICEINNQDTSWLHPDELQVFHKKKRAITRQQFFASRYLMKQINLGQRTVLWQKHSALYDQTHGLVSVCGSSNPRQNRFCLSHSHQTVAAWQCVDAIAGIDVQHHSKSAKRINAIQKLLSPCDQQQLSEGEYTFYQIWVIKEAYAKLTHRSIFDVLNLPVRNIVAQNFVYLLAVNAQVDLAIVLARPPTSPLQVISWDFKNNYLQKNRIAYKNWQLHCHSTKSFP